VIAMPAGRSERPSSPQGRKGRRSTALLALAIGLGQPVALTGCGEAAKTEPAAPENRPVVTAKDSMDFYKKSKNMPTAAPKP